MRNIVVQQPQFLPWVGLWNKVLSSDLYIIYAGVKFDQSDHQHRVTINQGKAWITLPVKNNQRNEKIKDVQLVAQRKRAFTKIAKTIEQSFMTRKYKALNHRIEPIVQYFYDYPEDSSDSMLEVGHGAFLAMAQAFDEVPPIKIDTTVRHTHKINKLDDCLSEYMGEEDFRYLSGNSGLDYLGFNDLKTPKEFWVQYMIPPTEPDSIMKALVTIEDIRSYIAESAEWKNQYGESRIFM